MTVYNEHQFILIFKKEKKIFSEGMDVSMAEEAMIIFQKELNSFFYKTNISFNKFL